MILKIARLLLFASLMAGGISLSRLWDVGDEYWPLTEMRFVLLLSALVASGIALSSPASQPFPRSQWRWLVIVIFVHGAAAVSWLWGAQDLSRINELYELVLLLISLVLTGFLLARDPAGALRNALQLHYWLALAFVGTAILASSRITGNLQEFGIGGIGAARLLSLAVVAGFYLWTTGGGIKWLLPLPLFMAGVLLSGSRAAALALLLALLTIGTLSARRIKFRVGAVLKICAGAITLGALVLAFFNTDTGKKDVEYFWTSNFVYGGSLGFGVDEIYLADRDLIFQDVWQKFLENPLAGSGLASYVCPCDSEVIYPHNLLLGFAVDGGLFLLVAAVLSVVFPFFCWLPGRTVTSTFAAGGGVFILVTSLFSGSYYDARWLWVFLWIACVSHGYASGQWNEGKRNEILVRA